MVINQEALITDEVFLILIFIYSEAKRQDSNVRWFYIWFSCNIDMPLLLFILE